MPQLADMIRAKFPGAYDDLPDAALEQQVLAKHPEYADLATPKTQAVSPDEPGPEGSILGFDTRSLKKSFSPSELVKTAKGYGVGLLKGAGDVVNPMTYLRAIGNKDVIERSMVDVSKRELPGDYGMGNFRAIGQSLSTPEGIGRATAGVMAGAVLPRVAASTGRAMQNLGISSTERMLKVNKSTLEGLPKFGPDLQSRSRNVAQALLDDPHGQISKSGANAYADATGGLQAKVDALVADNPEARGSTQHLADALSEGQTRFRDQWAPGTDTAAYGRVADQVLNNPRILKSLRAITDTTTSDPMGRLTTTTGPEVVGTTRIPRVRAETARELTQGTYRNLGDSAYGELKGAETEAHKAAARGGRAIVNEAIPAAEPLNQTISKRIDLGQILDEAVFRSGKHNPVGLGELITAGTGHLGALPFGLVNRPMFGSPIARGLYQAGRSTLTPAQIRALLISALGQDRESP